MSKVSAAALFMTLFLVGGEVSDHLVLLNPFKISVILGKERIPARIDI